MKIYGIDSNNFTLRLEHGMIGRTMDERFTGQFFREIKYFPTKWRLNIDNKA